MSAEQESLEGKVMTVTGPIEADEMGVTLPHEHLLLHHTPPPVVLSDADAAAEELKAYAAAGGRTVVEVTSVGIRRDPVGLRYISEKSGVQIVMGCGYYKFRWHPPGMDRKTVPEIAGEMVKDITEGADGTGIRAGVIGEVGVSEILTANEEKSLIASAHAQVETGAAINLHIHLIDKAKEEDLRMRVLDLLEGEGVDLNRVMMSHCEAGEDAVVYHVRIASRGVYVEYDLFGMAALTGSDLPVYEKESVAIKALIERGFLEKILISQDVCYAKLLTRNGGWGYAHILNDVVPRFVANGITEAEIQAMMVENPRRVFPFSKPKQVGDHEDRPYARMNSGILRHLVKD